MSKKKADTAANAEGVVVALLLDHPIDGISYKAGTPLQCAPDLAAQLVTAGIADNNQAAVEYALAEGRAIFVHESPAAGSATE